MKRTSRQMTIQQLSDQLQLPKSTLRFWEKKFQEYIGPERTPGGQRRYTVQHVLKFDQIKRLRERGQGIDEIKRSLRNGCYANGEQESTDQIKRISTRIGKIISDELYHLLSFELLTKRN
jgi:DNA-binding transcriptional MerR regulator